MNQQLIEKILDYAVCHGADFTEVFYEDVRRSNLTVLDQKVLDSSAGAEKGVGIRLFRGTESAYLYTADLSEENLLTIPASIGMAALTAGHWKNCSRLRSTPLRVIRSRWD